MQTITPTVDEKAETLQFPKFGTRIISEVTGAQYIVGSEFNHGAFGVVFECMDEWGHSLVAKVVKPAGDLKETADRVTSEVVAQAIARSPHIVHVHDAFVLHGLHYIISERCTFTLREMIERDTFEPRFWFRPFVKSMLHAIHFVHINGIAHCDIHAGNVFLHFIPDSLLPNEHTASLFKLGDFGLARPLDALEVTGTFMNCLRPPEVLDSSFGPLDHRVDVYQAGLLFLNFITKSEMFFSDDEILKGAPREYAEALGTPAGSAIARMLRRHVTQRTNTALAAWREISCALDQSV